MILSAAKGISGHKAQGALIGRNFFAEIHQLHLGI
jgi:hypothetical protein